MAKTAATHVDVRYRATDSAGTWSKPQRFAVADAIPVNGLERGKSYDFQVRGVSACGATSDWANATHVVQASSMQPLAPTAISATSLADGVHLDWTVPSMQSADVEYEIWRAPDVNGAPGAFAKLTTVRALGYTDGVTDGVVRWYEVRAINYKELTSGFSASVNSRGKVVEDGATVGATAAQAAQIAASYQPGQNIVPNPSFAIGCDQNNPIGWVLAASGVTWHTYRNRSGFPTCLEGMMASATAVTSVTYSTLFPIPGTGPLSAQCKYDLDRSCATGDASCDIEFFDGSVTHISYSPRLFQTGGDTPAYVLAQLANIPIPANAVYARIRVFFEGASENAGPVYLRITDLKIEIGTVCTPFSDYATTFGHDLVVQGSGRQLGGQGNMWPQTWAGVRSVLSTSPISYSIGTNTPATVTFNVAAFTNYGGDTNPAYNASSGSVSQTRGTTVTYYLYYLDPQSTGGSKTLNITTNIANLAQLGAVNIGNASVAVPASGGGSGTGGGGGGWCVCDDMWVDVGTQAKDAPVGHLFDCCDLPTRGTEIFQRAMHSVEYHDEQCVRITTECGAVLDCGITTPFDTLDGRALRAPQMQGELVLTDRGLERVERIESIGIRRVCYFHFGGVSYAAGRDTRPWYLRWLPQWLLPRRLRRNVVRIYSHNAGTLKP